MVRQAPAVFIVWPRPPHRRTAACHSHSHDRSCKIDLTCLSRRRRAGAAAERIPDVNSSRPSAGFSQTRPFTLIEVGVVAASILVCPVAMLIRAAPPIDIRDIVDPGPGASRHLFLQYAFDFAALLVTELPFSRADVVVYLIR